LGALAFLGLKERTKDVDIVCRSREPEVGKFRREYPLKYKVKAEYFVDGLFQTIRIKVYLEKAYPSPQQDFPNIDLKILDVHDIILTKLNRSQQKDIEDIVRVLSQTAISKTELDKRFRYLLKFTMASNKEHFAGNYTSFLNDYGSLLKP
jgi:hypothetical protein